MRIFCEKRGFVVNLLVELPIWVGYGLVCLQSTASGGNGAPTGAKSGTAGSGSIASVGQTGTGDLWHALFDCRDSFPIRREGDS